MHVRSLSLREYQQQLIERIRATTSSEATSSHLGFEAGEQLWAVPLTEVSEVIPTSALTSVPLTESWFMGMANIRGSLYAVTDFARFVSGSMTPITAECRFILLHERYRAHAALLIRRSLGLRQLRGSAEQDAAAPKWQSATHGDMEGRTWRELTVQKLTRDPRFLRAGR